MEGEAGEEVGGGSDRSSRTQPTSRAQKAAYSGAAGDEVAVHTTEEDAKLEL